MTLAGTGHAMARGGIGGHGGGGDQETGDVLLIINDSDPSNVTITATGAFAFTNDSSTNENEGVDLLEFFTAPVAILPPGSPASPGLSPTGDGPYTQWQADDYSGSLVDLNISTDTSGPETQTFTTTSPAFTGSATLDLSSFSADLPSLGSSGLIVSGNSNNNGDIIGDWEVEDVPVPEPSQYGWGVLLATLGFVTWRRFSGRFPFVRP